MATEENQGTRYGRWRLITIDGADLVRRLRSLRHDTADTAQLDADRLSFTRSIRLAHRRLTAQAASSP
ncbi:hypothetical protein [Streptomyces celluloflavus]|uniref:hypothetical protein n=1 Tax=Streptomyces celluloflavus TaxID=58344 RepID=UPI0036581DCE